jgi:chromosomal replication initiator protein
MDTKKMWDTVLVEIELTVSKANFKMWFKDTYILKVDDGIVHLSVASVFVKDWLYNKFHKTILKFLRNMADIRGIEYVVAKESNQKQQIEEVKTPFFNPTSELPLNDYYINKEDNLNPRYTFDSFVVGPYNELAYAAAQAVIKKPGINYNPLFIYGDTGRGKTHLIQAVGNYLKTNTQKKIFYVTSERFSLDYINSVQNNRVNSFKEKYRKFDVLIMDDIQFFSNKEKSQEELFHLFNNLYDDNKQIVFSSDKHPNYIPQLEERLKSRFGAGMIIDIPHPDVESRAAILRAKAKFQNYELSPENLDFLSNAIDGNIRELEGALNSIIMQSQLKGKELSLNEIKNLIKNNTKPKKLVSVKDVIKTIADFYNIEESVIYEKTRRKEVVRPRQLIMYVLREEFDVSYPSIGQKLGGRDHTTVIHSCEKIKSELKTNHVLVEELKQIKSMF